MESPMTLALAALVISNAGAIVVAGWYRTKLRARGKVLQAVRADNEDLRRQVWHARDAHEAACTDYQREVDELRGVVDSLESAGAEQRGDMVSARAHVSELRGKVLHMAATPPTTPDFVPPEPGMVPVKPHWRRVTGRRRARSTPSGADTGPMLPAIDTGAAG